MTDSGLPAGRKGLLILALAAVAAAVVLVVVAVRAQVSAPRPQDAGRIDPPGHSHSGHHDSLNGTGQGGDRPPLGPSRPTSLSIPSIGVHTTVNPIGLADDGTLAVPQPGPHLDQAAWFQNSPSPGQPGPSIIEGHVDSTEGPSVFFKLGEIHPGDSVIVRRSDHRVLTFRVDAVRDFSKAAFPTRMVYGGKDLSRPTLRLITCSDYDATIHHHVGNEVVFAHLAHTSPAS